MPARFAAALLLLLPACATLAQAHAPAHSPGRPETVVCFGDSLTAGYGAPAGASYPDNLRRGFQQAGTPVVLLNQGISGNTTKDGVARLAGVVRLHPAIVVLEFGANDGLRGFPIESTKDNLTAMIEQLQRAHIRILLLGMKLPPNLGPDYVGSFDALFPAMATRYKLAFVPFLLDNVWDHQDLLSPDNLHPNAAGYRVVASNIRPALEQMLAGASR